MKRAVLLSVLIALSAGEAVAQLGRPASLPAGSPADRAFLAIEREADAAKKMELLEKFVEEFAGDARLLGYRRLQTSYLQQGASDKAIFSGFRALQLDASDFSTLTNLARAFVQKQDLAQTFNYGLLAAGLVQRLKAMGPPEGSAPGLWENHKANLLGQAEPDYQYVEYTLFQLAGQQTDAATQGELFERYIETFTDSRYLPAAYQGCFGAYQRLGNADKIVGVGDTALAANPDNVLVSLLLADTLSEMGQRLDRAEALAQRIPELADKAARPESQSEEQWTQQKNTWKGLAHSIQGQILMHRGTTAEAADKFVQADPLLGEPMARARNLYRLGFAYAKLGKLDLAQRYLTQAVAMETPYKALAQGILTEVNKRLTKRP